MRYNTATVCIHVHVFFCAYFHALQHLQTLKKSCPVINIWSVCLLFCTFPEVHSYQWIKVRFMINSDWCVYNSLCLSVSPKNVETKSQLVMQNIRCTNRFLSPRCLRNRPYDNWNIMAVLLVWDLLCWKGTRCDVFCTKPVSCHVGMCLFWSSKPSRCKVWWFAKWWLHIVIITMQLWRFKHTFSL